MTRSGPGTPAHSVRLAERADVDRLGAVLADAFADDPVSRFVVPGGRRYYDRLRRLHRMEAARHVRLGSTWVVGEPAPVGAALWAAPGKWRQTTGDVIRSALPAIGIFGRSLPRSLRVFRAIESVHPTEPHWYLAILGTLTAAQGRGVGSAVLQPVLERCDAEGVPAYLESSKAANVPFYERHGFRVTGSIEIPDGPALDTMWREPSSA